jgi:biopolymer transport protein TolQ
MNVIQSFSLLTLIVNASMVVKVVMALLLLLSLISWTCIFQKTFSIFSVRLNTERFEKIFWQDNDLVALHKDITLRQRRKTRKIGALERIFESGVNEFNKSRISINSHNSNESAVMVLDNTQRAMHAATQREIDSLESSLSFLASVGSVSPYIGLLGTVWGIMNAFRGLTGSQQHMTLAAVAPGIAEALIATTAGLLVAIPAIVAYNFFTRNIDRLIIRFENFTTEFSNVLQHQSC